MTSQELRNRLQASGVSIPDSHMRWIRIVYENTELTQCVEQKKLFIDNHEDLPSDFRPSDVDSRIYSASSGPEQEGNLTLLGVYLVDDENTIFDEVDAIVSVVRQKLEENPQIEEISSADISDNCDIHQDRVGNLLSALRDLGFHHGLRTQRPGDRKVVSIKVDDVSDVRSYFNYESVSDQLKKRVERIAESVQRRGRDYSAEVASTALETGPESEDGTTFWDRLHPAVSEVARTRFESGHFADAVEASLRELETAVSEKADVYNRHGRNLMHHVFSSSSPVLSLTDRQGETGENIQVGYQLIFSGTWAAVRNPKSHHNLEISATRAVHFLYLVSLLFQKLDDADRVEEIAYPDHRQ